MNKHSNAFTKLNKKHRGKHSTAMQRSTHRQLFLLHIARQTESPGTDSTRHSSALARRLRTDPLCVQQNSIHIKFHKIVKLSHRIGKSPFDATTVASRPLSRLEWVSWRGFFQDLHTCRLEETDQRCGDSTYLSINPSRWVSPGFPLSQRTSDSELQLSSLMQLSE